MSDDGEFDAISKLLGVRDPRTNAPGGLHVVANDRRTIADDAMTLLGHALDDMGGEVPASVRILLTGWARRTACSAFYDSVADQFGIATEQGIQLALLAIKHSNAARQLLRDAMQARALLAKPTSETANERHARLLGKKE